MCLDNYVLQLPNNKYNITKNFVPSFGHIQKLFNIMNDT